MPLLPTKYEFTFRNEKHGEAFRLRSGKWKARMNRPCCFCAVPFGDPFHEANTMEDAWRLAFEDYRDAGWYPEKVYDEMERDLFETVTDVEAVLA